MRKRALIFITILLMTGISAGWYFFAKESRYLGTSPLKAVPVESPFFVRIRNLGDFTAKTVKNSSWLSLENLPEVSDLYRDIAILDSLIHLNKENENFLRHKELIVVPADSSKLYLLEIGSITEKKRISTLIRNYFQSKNIVVTVKDFKDASLQQYEWIAKGEKRRVLVTFHQGILIVSNELSQLQMAIEQMDKPSFLDDASYLRVNKNSTENVDLNIFVNHKTFPSYLSGFCTDSLATGILLPNYAKWTEVDVIQKENQLLVNGFTVMDTSSTFYLDVFKRQKPLANSLIRYLPAVTTFYASQHLSQPKLYFEDYAGYLLKNGKLAGYKNQFSDLSKELNLDLRQYLVENWTGESAVVFTNQNLEEPSDNRFFLIKVKTVPNDPLVAAIKKWSATSKNRVNDFESEDAGKNNIWKVPCENFAGLIGNLNFCTLKTKWMTVGEGFVLMGETPGSLKRYLNYLKRNELLQDKPSYTKFTSGLASTSSFYLWSAPGQSLPFFESFFRSASYQNFEKAVSSLKKVEHIAWQWGYENGMIYNTASLFVNPAADQSLVPFWRYPLKAKMRSKPVFVSYSLKNPGRELVFQDEENNLINLDKEGIERWKIRLEGAIMGEIKTIDYHNNGEFQLLFNTGNAIHLIDRNGLQVKNFPIKLKSGATNEMSVFDYDGQKDYRFLVACRDHKVYNFDKKGKPVPGWLPKATAGFVEFPVRHFRVGSKDYIVFFDRNHTYILDRQGKERVKMKDEFVHSGNNISLVTGEGIPAAMVTTDESGKIRLLGFDGATRKISAGNFSSGHYFLPAEVSEDGSHDYLFVDKQTLSLYDLAGNLIFSHPLQGINNPLPAIKPFGNERIIELYSAIENKTILVRKDGSIFDVFLPEKYSLLTIGSFNNKAYVSNILACSSDGFLSNFQMIAK